MLEKRVKGHAGVIVLDRDGGIGIFYNTPKMVRAYMREGMSCPTKSI
jgi:isoaspartyl peptidase/L-asparaginase-like protein (Ntn-hydrolase superfamily)